MVRTYKYLSLQLDDKLDRSMLTDTLYMKGLFTEEIGVLQQLQKTIADVLANYSCQPSFLCRGVWGRQHQEERHAGVGRVSGRGEAGLSDYAERRTLDKLLSLMENGSHPLHTSLMKQRSAFNGQI